MWNIGYHFIQCKKTNKHLIWKDLALLLMYFMEKQIWNHFEIKLVCIHLCCVESMQQQVDEYIVTDTAVESMVTLKIPLLEQLLFLSMCTQQHRRDHCLQRLFLTFVVILWFLSLSISVKVPKALSEHQMGPAHNTFFPSKWKMNKHAHLDIWPSIYMDAGLVSLNSFCLCILHFLFVLNFYNLLIVIWNPPKCIKNTQDKYACFDLHFFLTWNLRSL